jgi:DNA polymerase-1
MNDILEPFKKACPPSTARWLLQQGTIALTKASSRGMFVDISRAKKLLGSLHKEAESLQKETLNGSDCVQWIKRYGTSASFSKNQQVEDFFFNLLELPHPYVSDMERRQQRTSHARYESSVSEGGANKDILESVDHPVAEKVLRWRKLDKAEDFLEQIIRETVDGVLRPSFSLTIPHSYRSSSSNPNGQNFPARDEEIAAIIRGIFYAPKGWRIVERDYKGIEVSGGACYHRDPAMIRYLTDKTTDMHRDVSMDVYLLEQADISKKTRYSGKNGFTFPAFYGSYWAQMAPSLWRNIKKLKLKRERDGVCLYEHLKQKGIKGLGDLEKPAKGTFAAHVQQVEKRFWGERFAVYNQWKQEWYDLYCRRGFIPTLTGFTFKGHYRKNQVINMPVQGSSFHCELRGFIRMTQELEKRHFESYLCSQIHDSIIGMVKSSEFDDYNALAEEVTVKELVREWEWIIVPIEVEVEASPDGGTWWEKKGVK